jgi:hypothetical protein
LIARPQALLGTKRKINEMRPKVFRTIRRLVARTIIGVLIGIVIVILYFTIHYLATTWGMGRSGKQLYFFDNREAFITVLAMGILIGAVIGFGWGINSKELNK